MEQKVGKCWLQHSPVRWRWCVFFAWIIMLQMLVMVDGGKEVRNGNGHSKQMDERGVEKIGGNNRTRSDEGEKGLQFLETTACKGWSCPLCAGFRCENGHCLMKTKVCDGVDDCGDNYDEEVNCTGSLSPPSPSIRESDGDKDRREGDGENTGDDSESTDRHGPDNNDGEENFAFQGVLRIAVMVGGSIGIVLAFTFMFATAYCLVHHKGTEAQGEASGRGAGITGGENGGGSDRTKVRPSQSPERMTIKSSPAAKHGIDKKPVKLWQGIPESTVKPEKPAPGKNPSSHPSYPTTRSGRLKHHHPHEPVGPYQPLRSPPDVKDDADREIDVDTAPGAVEMADVRLMDYFPYERPAEDHDSHQIPHSLVPPVNLPAKFATPSSLPEVMFSGALSDNFSSISGVAIAQPLEEISLRQDNEPRASESKRLLGGVDHSSRGEV